MAKTVEQIIHILKTGSYEQKTKLFKQHFYFFKENRQRFHQALRGVINEADEFPTDDRGNNFLIYAAQYGDKSVMEFLLQQTNPPLNKTGGAGDAPLIIAAKRGHVGIGESLLVKGADISATNSCGETALSLAIAYRRKKIVPLLCRNKHQNEDGITPFIMASSKSVGGMESIYRVDPDALNDIDKEGRSAFWCAASSLRMEAMRWLLANGADPELPDNYGISPSQILALHIKLEKDEGKRSEIRKIFKEICCKKNPDFSEEDIDAKIKLDAVKTMLQLTYSKKDVDVPTDISLAQIVVESGCINQAKTSEKNKERLTKVFSEVAKEGIFVKGDRFFKTLRCSFKDHEAYCLVECDQQDRPLNITYIDGNAPLGSAVVNFQVGDKYKSFSGLQYFFSGLSYKIGKEGYGDFKSSLEKEFKLDFAADNSEVEMLFFGVQQSRGNCSFKSLTLLARVILAKVYGEEIQSEIGRDSLFEVIELIHKAFKYAFIENEVENLAQIAKLEGIKPEILQEAARFLQEEVGPNAQRKIDNKSEWSGSAKLATLVLQRCQPLVARNENNFETSV